MTFARRIAIGAAAASLVPLLFAALIFANLKEGTGKRQQVLRAQEALVLTGLLGNQFPFATLFFAVRTTARVRRSGSA